MGKEEGQETEIKAINFLGNKRFSDNELKSLIRTKESRWWRLRRGRGREGSAWRTPVGILCWLTDRQSDAGGSRGMQRKRPARP